MTREDQENVPTVSAMSAIYQSMATVFTSDERHRHTARRLLLATGVWMPLEVYKQWPVLFPWIVRDTQLANSQKGIADATSGLQRQDNGPIGRLKNGLPVSWATAGPTFNVKPLKRGQQQWWQAHVWEGMTTSPLTNSFVPNLVWFPEAIGRLTDPDVQGAEGTLFQEEIKAIAWSLYRHAPVIEPLQDTVERIWLAIPEPATTRLEPEEEVLVNWFKPTPSFLAERAKQHAQVWKAVNNLLAVGTLDGLQLTPKTYRTTLPRAGAAAWASLRSHLEPFAKAADHFDMANFAGSAPVPPQTKTDKALNGKVTGTALPITLDPTDTAAFKAALLESKQAEIEVVYNDGHVVTEMWNAQKFGRGSSVIGNLRARPKFRAGAWQAAGIAEVRVRVLPSA